MPGGLGFQGISGTWLTDCLLLCCALGNELAGTWKKKETGTTVAEAAVRDAVFLSFPVAAIKYSAKSNLKENKLILAHSSRVPSIRAGESKR